MAHPGGAEPRAQLERAGSISVGAQDRQTRLKRGRENSSSVGTVWWKYFRMGRSSHDPTPPVGKRGEVALDDLGGQLAHSAEEEVALGIALGLGP